MNGKRKHTEPQPQSSSDEEKSSPKRSRTASSAHSLLQQSAAPMDSSQQEQTAALHAAISGVATAAAQPQRAPSQRKRMKNATFDEQFGFVNPTLPQCAAGFLSFSAVSAAAASTAADSHNNRNNSAAAASSNAAHSSTDPALARCLTAQEHRKVAREHGGGLKAPKSNEHWIAVGVWIASREFPDLPFFVPLVDPDTGRRLNLPVPYKSMMASLSPKYNDRDCILLHARVVQRLDSRGRLFGEVRYLCTDIAVSYQMGDNAFKWIIFHPDMFQVCCNTWNSSLNRRELFEHLRIAHSKGGMVFQAEGAETTRRFLKAILEGKGLPAECTLKNMPSSAAIAAATTAAAYVAEAGIVVNTNAITAAGMAHMLPSQPTLQTLPEAHSLFQEALSRAEPLWFHPSVAEQLSMDVAAAASTAHPAIQSSSTRKYSSSAKQTDTKQMKPQFLPFVLFVSTAQTATSTKTALPRVVICNAQRTINSSFASLPPDAVAMVASTLTAAAAAAPPKPSISRGKKKTTTLREHNSRQEEEEGGADSSIGDSPISAAEVNVDATALDSERLNLLEGIVASQQEQTESTKSTAALETLASLIPFPAVSVSSPAGSQQLQVEYLKAQLRMVEVKRQRLAAQAAEIEAQIPAAERDSARPESQGRTPQQQQQQFPQVFR